MFVFEVWCVKYNQEVFDEKKTHRASNKINLGGSSQLPIDNKMKLARKILRMKYNKIGIQWRSNLQMK